MGQNYGCFVQPKHAAAIGFAIIKVVRIIQDDRKVCAPDDYSTKNQVHIYFLISPYIILINTSILLRNIQDAQNVCAPDGYSIKMRFTDIFWSPCILYLSVRPYYCEIYRMLKKSVHLTITVQKSGAQILFDHTVYYIYQHVHIIAKYTGCSKSLCTWWLQYKNEVHRYFLITLYIIFINVDGKCLELTVHEMLYELNLL